MYTHRSNNGKACINVFTAPPKGTFRRHVGVRAVYFERHLTFERYNTPSLPDNAIKLSDDLLPLGNCYMLCSTSWIIHLAVVYADLAGASICACVLMERKFSA